ncbi:MAG: flagellar export protein FliJ [Deltaproteobacteria bacterium]|nr:MAG: flagellar export protein FliJ [Deltaproteobacteria bacterium]
MQGQLAVDDGLILKKGTINMVFKFRYESLLNYRRHLKEVAQVELARSMEQLAVAKETLESLTAEYDKATLGFATRLRQGITAQRLQDFSSYLSRLKEEISQKALEVAEWEEFVEKKRSALLEKDREFKIIDKLRDKDFERWVAEQESREQKALSEMAILRHGRSFR